MKIEFLERNYKISNKLKDIITDKVERLSKYFGDDAKVKVLCSEQNKTQKLELTIVNKGMLYRSEVSGDEMYNNIDLALPKIERQIVRHKDKKIAKSRVKEVNAYEFIKEEPEEELADVYKKKSFNLDPITVDEAKDYIERLGHTFFVFLNAETGKVNVLYKRKDEKCRRPRIFHILYRCSIFFSSYDIYSRQILWNIYPFLF